MRLAIIFFSLCLQCSSALQGQTHFKVYLAGADTVPPYIYVAGDFNGWQPALPPHRLFLKEGSYQGTFYGLSSSIEFKFTLGSWELAEIDSVGAPHANRFAILQPPDTLVLKVRFPRKRTATRSPNVHLLPQAFYMPQLQRERKVWLYLPPNYQQSSQRYPVWYMHDGQNLFDASTGSSTEWRIDESLDSLAALGHAVPIVVGINHGGSKRLEELSPFINSNYGGGRANHYLHFITQVVKPYIDSNYRTLPQRQHTGIGGSSLGGLASIYALAQYPQVFSKALIFSPAYWFNPQIYEHLQKTQWQNNFSVYQMAGELERVNGGVALADDLMRMEQILSALNSASFVLEKKVVDQGEHSEKLWQQAFPEAFLWFNETSRQGQ